jgi:hypothetical protein
VVAGSDLDSEGVGAIGEHALFPGDEAAEKGSTGGPGALSGNERELGGGCGEGIEGGEGGY